MKLGSRLPSQDERDDTAIASMMLGAIGGHSKIGMPVRELQRQPLVAAGADAFEVYAAGGQVLDLFIPNGQVNVDWNGAVVEALDISLIAAGDDLSPSFGTAGTFAITGHIEVTRIGTGTYYAALIVSDATLTVGKAYTEVGPFSSSSIAETLSLPGYLAAAGDVVTLQVFSFDSSTATAIVGAGSYIQIEAG